MAAQLVFNLPELVRSILDHFESDLHGRSTLRRSCTISRVWFVAASTIAWGVCVLNDLMAVPDPSRREMYAGNVSCITHRARCDSRDFPPLPKLSLLVIDFPVGHEWRVYPLAAPCLVQLAISSGKMTIQSLHSVVKCIPQLTYFELAGTVLYEMGSQDLISAFEGMKRLQRLILPKHIHPLCTEKVLSWIGQNKNIDNLGIDGVLSSSILRSLIQYEEQKPSLGLQRLSLSTLSPETFFPYPQLHIKTLHLWLKGVDVSILSPHLSGVLHLTIGIRLANDAALRSLAYAVNLRTLRIVLLDWFTDVDESVLTAWARLEHLEHLSFVHKPCSLLGLPKWSAAEMTRYLSLFTNLNVFDASQSYKLRWKHSRNADRDRNTIPALVGVGFFYHHLRLQAPAGYWIRLINRRGGTEWVSVPIDMSGEDTEICKHCNIEQKLAGM